MFPSGVPFVSIIVPYGAGRGYQTVLQSIRLMDYPRDRMELLVIEGRLPARQRNAGIAAAKGEFIFFFDDDVTHHPDIIRRMLKFYDDPAVAIVGGPNVTPPTDSFLQKCFGYVMSSYFATTSMSARYTPKGGVRVTSEKELILCNLSGRAGVLKKHPLNEHLFPAEENEWFNRIQNAGYKLIYDPDSVSFHSRRPTVGKFIKQNFGYGRGRMELFLLQPSAFKLLFMAPSLFILYLLSLPFLFLYQQLPLHVEIVWSAPAVLYCLCALIASCVAGIKSGNFRSIAVLPFLFPLVHIPYGFGIAGGLLKRLKGWKSTELPITVRKQPL
ncbi:MAG: glycosyltransferase [Chitinispirillaceae bacterium]|nr:glycosyltransferase [Chitinispirillaceae bacterium]